jgi:hypothetical protein
MTDNSLYNPFGYFEDYYCNGGFAEFHKIFINEYENHPHRININDDTTEYTYEEFEGKIKTHKFIVRVENVLADKFSESQNMIYLLTLHGFESIENFHGFVNEIILPQLNRIKDSASDIKPLNTYHLQFVDRLFKYIEFCTTGYEFIQKQATFDTAIPSKKIMKLNWQGDLTSLAYIYYQLYYTTKRNGTGYIAGHINDLIHFIGTHYTVNDEPIKLETLRKYIGSVNSARMIFTKHEEHLKIADLI